MPVVVSFISQKGGVGKSTLARALAAVASHAGVRVLLVDLDPQQRTLLRWEKQRPADARLPTLTVKGFGSVSDALAAAEDYELLILDTPGSTTRVTLEIARKSHLIVQPTGPTLDDLEPAVLLFHELAEAGIPKERLLFALCRTLNKEEEREAHAYLKETTYPVLQASIPERALYRDAHNRGYALTETKEQALNERADALLAELLTKVSESILALKLRAGVQGKKKGGAS